MKNFNHSQKSATLCFEKFAKNAKKGPKTGKKLFSLINSSPFI